MQGPGHAIKDGSLGSPMRMGPAQAIRDGSLGGGFAGPQTRHPEAWRDGSLGCSTCGVGITEAKVSDLITLDMIVGAAVGAIVAYLYLSTEK